MKLKILILTAITVFTGCVSTRTYSTYVREKLETQLKAGAIQHENILFDLTHLREQAGLVESEKVNSFFIPAILYWGWENTIECSISPSIAGEMFKSNFLDSADSLGLLQNLNGQNLEITVEALPTRFVYTNQGSTMIFIIAYTVSTLEAIYPEEQNLVITYKLSANGQETKAGRITALNTAMPIKNIWKSTKKFTWMYIDRYDYTMKTLTHDIVRQLQEQL